MMADHVLPPGFFDVTLEFDPERAVIPAPIEASIDLAGGEDEPSAFRERGQFLH